MKSPFLNKTKKYIASFLAVIFVSSLFFGGQRETKAYSVTVVADVSVTSIMSTNALVAIAKSVIATEAAIVPIVTPAVVSTATETAVATADQVKTSWWTKTLKFFKDEYFHISSLLNDKAGLLKEYVLDPLFWTMANVIIDQFGDAIVNWIRNGFEGSPMFLSDPEGFFRDTANQASGAIIDDLNMEWLCDPLGKLRINLDFFFPGTDRAKYKCTFNDIAGNFKNIAGRKDLSDWVDVNVNVHQQNIVRLYGSDYRYGGFLMWMTTAGWKNNDLGRTIQLADNAYAAASASVSLGRFTLFNNGGFFGVKKCVEWGPAPLKEGEMGPPKQKCLKKEDSTPGTLVQEQLNQAANGSLKRLQIADEVDEIIGALATTMVGWMLTGGNDGGGVLAYDKDADYSASNRDHMGALSDSQTLTKKKTDISSQVVVIKSGNDSYNNALKNNMDISGDAENNSGIVLAKLKCIRATSTNDVGNVYNDSACFGASEKIKNIKLTTEQIVEITTDINKIESDVDQGGIDKDNKNEFTISARTAELLDEFENKATMTTALEDIDVIIEEYCYSYNEIAKVGTICGLYVDKKGNSKQETHTTHSEEEANAINEEIMNKVPELKTAELEYSCILNKYTKTEKVEEGVCKAFVKTDYAGSSSSSSSVSPETAGVEGQ